MTVAHDVVRPLAVLGATVGGVAAVTFGLVGLLSPVSPVAAPTVTPEPTFDLAIAPDAVGGRLAVSGDRSATMRLDRLESRAGYEAVGDSFEIVMGPASLVGPDGRIAFGRDPAEGITQVDYDGLSFYLDPGDCTVTAGAVNPDAGLMAARIECADISDIRDGGTISLDGIVALPANLLGDRSGLPLSGGRLELGSTTIEIPEAVGLIDAVVIDAREVSPIGLTSEDGGTVVVLELDRETGEYAMTSIHRDGAPIDVSPACPLAAETIGRLSPQVTVVQIEFECGGVPLPDGETGSVTGTVVVDIIEDLPEAPPRR